MAVSGYCSKLNHPELEERISKVGTIVASRSIARKWRGSRVGGIALLFHSDTETI
jgi:hypothetical protein